MDVIYLRKCVDSEWISFSLSKAIWQWVAKRYNNFLLVEYWLYKYFDPCDSMWLCRPFTSFIKANAETYKPRIQLAMYEPVHVLSRKSTRQHRNVFIWCTAERNVALGYSFWHSMTNVVLKPLFRLACWWRLPNYCFNSISLDNWRCSESSSVSYLEGGREVHSLPCRGSTW